MKTVYIVLGSVIVLFIVAQFFIHRSSTKIEYYPYTVTSVFDGIEIRDYQARLFTTVAIENKGYKKNASNGFSKLGGYIFGANARNQKIAMTSPVEMWNDESTTNMAFTMPSEYSFTNLPEPNNKNINLVKIPERLVAVKKFSGFYGSNKVNKIAVKLGQSLMKRNLQSNGSYILAVYDPPTTLPFLRRNEILMPIKEISYSEETVSEELS